MSRTIDPRQIEVIDDDLAAVLRTKTPGERIQMAAEANQTARIIVAAGVRHTHPNWLESQVAGEVARRMLGAAD
jgi:hypothetical protein